MHDEDLLTDEMLEKGADGYILKSANADQLFDAINSETSTIN